MEIRYRAKERKLNNEQPEIAEEYYYYNQLNHKEQLLFDSIITAAESYQKKTEILPYRYSEDEFIRVIKSVKFDSPELFYIDINSSELFCDNYKTTVHINFLGTPAEIKEMKMETEAVCAAALAYINEANSDFEKTVILHDYLINSCSYLKQNTDDKSNTIHTAYGALVDKKASCDGYASAFKILLNRCGIECIIAEGTVDNQPHLWNIAKQDGKYYHIDCTWNDADIDTLSNLAFHGFFNLSDRAVLQDRKIDNTFNLPDCTDENNYYTVIGAKATSLETLEETAYKQLKLAVENDRIYFEFLPDFTSGESDFKENLLKAIDRINSEYDSPILSRSYRLYNT